MNTSLNFFSVCFLILIIPISSIRNPGKLTNEKKLIKHLKDNYPVKWGRPVRNTSETLYISIGITLMQILDLDASSQSLVTNIWTKFSWIDPYLSWDPSEYGGLSTVRLPASEVFTPDIVLFNNADTRIENQRDALVVIYSNGEILWVPTSIFRSTCAIDIKFFPVDQQNCSMVFGSWTYESDKLDLLFTDDRPSVDLAEYFASNEWKLLDAPAEKHVKIINSKNYTDLTYYFILRRNGGFLSYILILPCMLLAFLTMVVFWLPPETPAKMILGMNIFVAFFLLLLLLADLVPSASSEIPIIGIYYFVNMVMIALSAFLCTIVIHIYFRADKFCKVPSPIKVIFLDGLARFYCMLPKQETITTVNLLAKRLLQNAKNVENGDKFEKFELLKERFKTYRENMIKAGFDSLMVNQNLDHQSGCLTNNKYNCYCQYYIRQHAILNDLANLNSLEHDVKEIRDYLRDTRKKLENREYKTKLASEWKLIALVLDRTFFFIFLFITIITLIILFPRNAIHKASNRLVNEVATSVVNNLTEQYSLLNNINNETTDYILDEE